MKITFSPLVTDSRLVLEKKGDVLTFNGEDFDFSPLLEGATLPPGSIKSEWIDGPVDKVDGEMLMTIRNPIGYNAPEESRYPVPIFVTDDGPVAIPVYDIEPEVIEDQEQDQEQQPAETDGETDDTAAQEETSDGQH